ncbi:tyrosine recombinase XerC [Streptomyces sp. NPDC048362]|uniref:site-specific integrase n=1 Tax=Streptomyces sp. NPDC048362 TaxID=3365539 RepID=UPI0037171792
MAKRRPNGGGTITKRSDGRYQGAAYVTDTDGNRVRKYVYGRTWDEANEKLGKLQDLERNGIPVPSRSWTLGEWMAYWLEHIVAPEREHNTYVKYESKVRLYLVPHLGKKPLVKLTPAQIRTFMATLAREKVGASARFEVLRVLRNALNRAMREELVTRNVALLVDMPKVSKDKGAAWNAREAIAFLRSVRAHRLYAACVLVLVLGLRRSEVLGLRWQDIDFEAGHFTPVKQSGSRAWAWSSRTSRRSPPRPCSRSRGSALGSSRSVGSSKSWNGKSPVSTGPRSRTKTSSSPPSTAA